MKPGRRALLWFAILSAISPAASAQVAPQWRSYRSPYYGFSLRYPSIFAFYSGHPDFQETQISMFPICDNTTVACVEYSFGENAHSAIGLSVNILRDYKTEAACNQPARDNDPALKPVTINGIAFRKGETDSVGLGSSSGGDIYRVFHQNVCFEVAVMTAGTNMADAEEQAPPFPEAKFRRISRDLDRMLKSFTFTGLVVDGSHWSVFSDGGCGTTFEYPDSTTVDQNVPFENESYKSQKITCSEHFLYAGRDYTASFKDDVSNPDPWLQSQGYPTLAAAQQLLKTANLTEYRAGLYIYVVSANDVTILSVSDTAHRVISPASDPTFAHLVRTLQQ